METRYQGSPVPLTGACREYTGSAITITVPSSGYVVVSAKIEVYISHTNGVEDKWFLYVEDAPAQCTRPDSMWRDTIPPDVATDTLIERTAFTVAAFFVAAGTYTYHVNGVMNLGAGTGDWFSGANLVAVFYPS